jgi:hypothetical protein
MTSNALNRSLLKANSDFKLRKEGNLRAAYHFKAFKLDEWEVSMYTIIAAYYFKAFKLDEWEILGSYTIIAAYYFRTFKLDEWEVGLYTIIACLYGSCHLEMSTLHRHNILVSSK